MTNYDAFFLEIWKRPQISIRVLATKLACVAGGISELVIFRSEGVILFSPASEFASGEAASEIPAPSLCPIFTAFISCKFIESCYPVITVSEHHCQFNIRDILH